MQPTTHDELLHPAGPAQMEPHEPGGRSSDGRAGHRKPLRADCRLDRYFDRVSLRDEVRRALQ